MFKAVRWALYVATVLLMAPPLSSAQIQHVSGQEIQPIFNGWERNPDGTFNMTFGYLNRNYVEELYVPVGPDNAIEPGNPDRGQPTHFYPRRQDLVFKVKVPSDWGKKELVWSLTVNGKVMKTYGELKLEYELPPRGPAINPSIDGVPVIEEADQKNQPPSVTVVGPQHVSITPAETVSMELAITDDGLPKPRPRTDESATRARRANSEPVVVGRIAEAPQMVRADPRGLSATWIHYRGPGKVTFTPRTMLVTHGKAATQAKFSEPGEYLIRAYIDDGMYFTTSDVMVTVKAAPSTVAR